MTTLCEAAVAVLTAADPADKLRLTAETAAAWAAGHLAEVGRAAPPPRPAHPEAPPLLPPNRMPRRGTGPQRRPALLHALAHIEFNAIDLAWDIIARFADQDLPRAFYDDWVLVAKQEAEHFAALDGLLRQAGSGYGALPAHDGLWDAARKTAGDLQERLAVVPMTLEARALDTAPQTIARFRESGDEALVAVLSQVVAEEIDHVAAGTRWFRHLCARRGEDPAAAYHAILRRRFPGGLKPPFNHEARRQAGLDEAFYEPLARGAAE